MTDRASFAVEDSTQIFFTFPNPTRNFFLYWCGLQKNILDFENTFRFCSRFKSSQLLRQFEDIFDAE